MSTAQRGNSRRSKTHKPKLRRKNPGSKKWVISPLNDVEPGDKIEWKATGTDIVIWFPPGNDPLKINERKVSKGKTFTKKVPPGLRKRGIFPYSVFCYETGELAESNSPPFIRIK